MGLLKTLGYVSPLGGYLRHRSEKKKKKKAEKKAKEQQKQAAMQKEAADIENTPLPSRESVQEVQNRVNELSEADAARDKQNREGYKQQAREDVTTDLPGISDKKRQAMQESANAQIGGHLQNYSRMLASSQGSRGVRGGKAQADLRRQALNAQNQVTRDINEQDEAQAMQRLAAYLTNVEGQSAQDILRRQQYQDYLTGEQQKKKQSAENLYNKRYFGKV